MAIFFATLNFNRKVLYAPSDFRDDQHFLDLITDLSKWKESQTEPQELETDDTIPTISVDDESVIKALGGKYTWRSVRGVAKQQKLHTADVLSSLRNLESLNLAILSADKKRWALTSVGRGFLEEYFPNERKD